ncbi:MAG TPA: hypothetical protein VGK40_03905 [Verrucomicrobiae bacterium]|jgi:hypothetical protein
MKQTTRTRRSSESWRDPRTTRGFRPNWHPKADGREAPPVNAAGRHDRIRAEFLAIYYELNRAYARLRQGKRSGGKARELAALRQIETILRRRDALEDRFAPYGVIAEPVIHKGFTVEVKFSFGDVQSVANRKHGVLYSSAYITIPLPSGVKLD